MLMPITSKVNEKGHLVIGGCDSVELQKRYGTPLYVIDIATVKKQCCSYKENFDFPDLEAEVIYASKAFTSIAMCQLIKEEGLSLDVSTGGELYTAIESGFPVEKIFFHGNNKSEHEIEYGLKNKVGYFIVDNFQELNSLEKLCKKNNLMQKIMLRITPGIKASTHEYIQTGNIESKFGFSLHNGAAFEAVEKVASSSNNLILVGLHSHIGSQIFNLDCYAKLIDVMLEFIREIKDKLRINITHLNVGGGLGIKYIPDDEPSGIEDLSRIIYQAIKKNEKKYGLKLDRIYLEPGRSIVGNSGMTFYKVGVLKEIPGIKNYIAIDGGMSDNIRPMLYKARYHAYIANRMNSDSNKNSRSLHKTYSIVGKHCESGDVLIADINLPEVQVGDLIATAATGAYCYSMSSNYNSQPKSAVVAVEDGKSWVWIERQDYKDLILGDRNLYE